MKTPERHQWNNHVKHLLSSSEFGSIWYNQGVTSNVRVFLKSIEQRNKDMYYATLSQ